MGSRLLNVAVVTFALAAVGAAAVLLKFVGAGAAPVVACLWWHAVTAPPPALQAACQAAPSGWTSAAGLPAGTQVKSIHVLKHNMQMDAGMGILSTLESRQYMTADMGR